VPDVIGWNFRGTLVKDAGFTARGKVMRQVLRIGVIATGKQKAAQSDAGEDGGTLIRGGSIYRQVS